MNNNDNAAGLGFVERPMAKSAQGLSFDPAAHGMLPVSLEVLPAEAPCPCDLFLPLFNQQRARVEMTLVCGEGQGFKEAWRQRLLAVSQRSAFVRLAQGGQMRDYLRDLAARQLEDPGHPPSEKRLLLKEMAALNLRELFADNLSPQVVGRAVGGIQEILELLTNDQAILTNLSEILRADHNTYAHSVNVSLLAMAMARHLKLTESRVKALGMAGMLHDVGLSKVAPEILAKPGPLDETEWALVRAHPFQGCKMLGHAHAISKDMLKMVLHHHENADGSGYPHGLTAERTPMAARLLRLVDAFDAMTSDRPYRPAMQAFEAASTIMRSPQHFDGELIPHFLRFLASPHMVRKQEGDKAED